MTPQSRRVNIKWFVLIGGALFFLLIVYSSFQQSVYHCEVCVEFHGRSHCAEASGAKLSDAVRSAQGIDCELIANGRDENIACLATPPSSVRTLSKR